LSTGFVSPKKEATGLDWEVQAEEASSLGELPGFRFSVSFYGEGGGGMDTSDFCHHTFHLPKSNHLCHMGLHSGHPSSGVIIPMVSTTRCSSATAYPGITASVIDSAASVIIAIHVLAWAITIFIPIPITISV
jgi:hypothetical protein